LFLPAIRSFTTIKSFPELELISPSALGLLAVTKNGSLHQRRNAKPDMRGNGKAS
jgi:hypothetical protein